MKITYKNIKIFQVGKKTTSSVGSKSVQELMIKNYREQMLAQ